MHSLLREPVSVLAASPVVAAVAVLELVALLRAVLLLVAALPDAVAVGGAGGGRVLPKDNWKMRTLKWFLTVKKKNVEYWPRTNGNMDAGMVAFFFFALYS